MATIKYRRNINCLSTEQLHDLREALAEMYLLPASNGDSFARLAGLHGLPSPFYCEHGYPGFLTWHRAYLNAFQDALCCINSDVVLPYWDWSSGPTTGVPPACRQPNYVHRNGNAVPNPLYSGRALGGGQTNRAANIDTRTFGDLATLAQTAMGNSNFSGFQSSLNSPHGSIHGRVGGHMSGIANAGYDPIFYLHHANVDRLWAKWQQSHPAPLPNNEKTKELAPFYKTFSTDLMMGADVETTDQLGYRYSTFCWFLPPFVLTDLLVLKLDPYWFRIKRTTAKLIMNSSKMSSRTMDLRVFVNDSRADSCTKTLDNPAFGGSFGVFGMEVGEEMSDKAMRVSSGGQKFDLEIDISDCLEHIDADSDELFLNLVPVGPDGQVVPIKHIPADSFELLLK